MDRYNLRTNIDIPVFIFSNQGSYSNATISNLGLDGAFIKTSMHLPENVVVKLKIPLKGLEDSMIEGKVLRSNGEGIAVRFINHANVKMRLWQHIKQMVSTKDTCPFCGAPRAQDSKRCSSCGFNIDFKNDRYLELYEKDIKDKWIYYLDRATTEHMEGLKEVELEIESGKKRQAQIYKKLEKVINDFLLKAEDFERGVGEKTLIKKAQIDFRLKTREIYSKSYCINRARTWPLGYQGDYMTLECIYRNMSLSQGIGYYLDLFALNVPLAEAVRNRIRKLEEILRTQISERKTPSVLNIGCGSCRELMGLSPEIKNSKAKITCIDNDGEALSFAQNRLQYVGLLANIDFYKYNALRMFDDEMNIKEFGKKDIIYSVGLFDYLPSDFLVKLFRALYNLLNPGGILIAAFKDADRYKPYFYHWIINWDGFLQRTCSEFRNIFNKAGIPETSISEIREETGIIIFYLLTR
jgi:SAM-dependent methyltransferase